MIGVIVTIGPGRTSTANVPQRSPKGRHPMFEGMDGLRSKVFMWDDETETVTNTYVWDSEPAARAFFSSPEVKAKIIELYGVEPQVRFAEVSALIDNTVGVA